MYGISGVLHYVSRVHNVWVVKGVKLKVWVVKVCYAVKGLIVGSSMPCMTVVSYSM